MRKRHHIFDSLLIATFIAGLVLPLVAMHNKDVSTIEKRKLAPFPELKWGRKALATFPSRFEAFFKDHFGFRDLLAQLYSESSLMLQSSSNPNVLIGKDDWLFYINPADGNSLEDYRKNDPLTPEELQQWRTALEARYVWFKQQGIQYLFVVAPDKHSIYGEYFPSRIRRAGTQSRLDQLLAFMHDSDVPMLDLRPSLIQAKSQGLLYLKTDTHWNALGAGVAQYAIMEQLSKHNPSLHPINYRAEVFSSLEHSGGDIANMLSLSSRLKEMSPQLYKPLSICNRQFLEEGPDSGPLSPFFTDCRADAPKALIFRDSFFEALLPYISPYFSKTLYVWKWPDFNQLEQYLGHQTPDIVIEERVERSLKAVPALPTPRHKAYRVFFEGWFQTGAVVYQIDEHGQDELTGRHQLAIIPARQSYVLRSQGKDPFFLLPEFKIDRAMQYIMKIILTAPQATSWQVFYGTVQQRQYNETHSVSGQLQAGENTFYVVLDDKDLQGQIRVDPGMVEGEYELKSLEIRAVRRKGG